MTSRTDLFAFVTAAMLICTIPISAEAHGGVVEEDDLCVINIGYLKAHFKIYVPRQTGHDEYCEDIPVRGESIFVMEYQHDGLNDASIDFRIIRNTTGKGRFARLEHVQDLEDLDAITVHYAAPSIAPDVFMLLQAFEEDGEYIGIVSAEMVDSGKTYTAVFPFEVGYTGIGVWPWIIAAVLFLQLNYWLMSRRRSTAVAAALLCCIAPALADKPSLQSESGHFKVGFVSEVEPIVINSMHSWILSIESKDGNAVTDAEIHIEGGMPEHDHGLPTRPRMVENLGNGRYRIDGLRFHMSGYWELEISIKDDHHRDTVTIALNLQ